MLPAAVRSASASMVRVFRGSIQSSSSRCVRFATTVTDDRATLATGRALPPTRSTGWIAPASPGARVQLLTAPGIPMLFMGQEFYEDKRWADDPPNHKHALLYWDGLG